MNSGDNADRDVDIADALPSAVVARLPRAFLLGKEICWQVQVQPRGKR